jgi:hypothetical protein
MKHTAAYVRMLTCPTTAPRLCYHQAKALLEMATSDGYSVANIMNVLNNMGLNAMVAEELGFARRSTQSGALRRMEAQAPDYWTRLKHLDVYVWPSWAMSPQTP